MKMRDYQVEAIESLRQGFREGHKRQILAAATGSGKTAMASNMIHGAAQNGKKSLFIVDRKVLVPQAVRHLEALDLKVGILRGEDTFLLPDDEVVVASIQTLRSRGFRLVNDVDLVVIDEAHQLHNAHIKLMESWSALPFIGLSATPLREDLGKYFTNLVRGPSIKWLTENEHLVKVKAYGPTVDKLKQVLDSVEVARGDFKEGQLGQALNTKELIGDVISTWQAKAENKRTLAFCCDVAHSEAMRDDFLSEGIEASHVDAHTPDDERQRIFDDFREGNITVLCSVGVISVGFDMPVAEVGILARPTLSLALHIQQTGRLIRIADGKEKALILDHAGNIARHGLPEDFVVPDLNNLNREPTRSKRNTVKMKPCSNCGFMLEPGQMTCPECGVDRPTRQATVHNMDGELIEIGSGKPIRRWDGDDRLNFFLELKNIQQQRGYRDTWPSVNFKNRFGDWPPRSWKGLPGIPASGQTQRWVKSQQIRWAKRQKAS